jgi:predicted AAA+ superfamily ATPase
MRDDELRRLITLANPWWNSAVSGSDHLAWTATHRLLAGRRTFDLGYRTHILDDIATESIDDSLIVLNGPRRVGKSVAMLDAIATLCARNDIDPRQIIHVPCDGMRDRDLRRVLTLGRALTASIDTAAPHRRMWFFDEISDINGWTTTLKQARDLTDFGDDTVVATGSCWVGSDDIYRHLMSGRAGTGGRRRVRQLLPMSFRDYLAVAAPQLPRPDAAHPADLLNAETRATLGELTFLVDEYDLAWQAYLSCGGFPRAAAEHVKTGLVSDAFCQDLLGWLRTDIDPDGPQTSIPVLLAELATRTTSPLNLRNLTAALDLGSPGVLNRRLSRMVASRAALSCHQVSDEARPLPGAQRKVYLVAPILAWIPSRTNPGFAVPDFTKLSESVLAVTLARRLDDLTEGRLADDDTVGYARTGSGAEVDFAPVRVPYSTGAGMTTPIESKWVDTGWLGEARTLNGKYGRGVLATKSILDLDHDVWAVPAPLVALLLE